ncbi:hypothetical protein WR25_21936 [Diploscapter pachys]|uniref:Glycerol-3-phosphate dehydrogenase NAD-dependent N-terminal domain-containing protein n=1 Tax=Diploscapter pachys TaxID=2018661 RepID=A0A2A2M4C1_9BILA|nr:hypothetical protein WR25_21936 [Diploscapter pachys]
MIGWAGAERFAAGLTDPLDTPARARWPLDPGAEAVRAYRSTAIRERYARGTVPFDRLRANGVCEVGRPGMSSMKIGVIGGGAWGTALAQVAAHRGEPVTLWAREPEVVAGINDAHENRLFLAGVPL